MTKQKKFNVTGICIPKLHYMVDTTDIIDEIIRSYITCDAYFTINRARQYGKSTTLELLYHRLEKDYLVLDISFEAAEDCFSSLYHMAQGIVNKISRVLSLYGTEDTLINIWQEPISSDFPLDSLNAKISKFCKESKKDIILMVDEVDKATEHPSFLSFLGLLREKYLRRSVGRDHTFKSVILAGVYDIRNLQMKLHPGQETHSNSPWNIAADFDLDMSLPEQGICGMLEEYEQDFHTGMDIQDMASLLFQYTSGYPYLVSRLCKIIDERIAGSGQFPDRTSAWTKEGFLAAVRKLLAEENTLFESLDNKLVDYPKLKEMLEDLLLKGQAIEYVPWDMGIRMAVMFGFIKIENGFAIVANRLFEIRLYNSLLAEQARQMEVLPYAAEEKNPFIINGQLDMERVIQKFAAYYTEIFGHSNEKFLEDHGRCIFLLYLKPIINGTGNYYIESRTRNHRRTDVIIDFRGQQYIIELKLWHGTEYNRRGEEQLIDYLDAYHLDKGYMISFNFNQKKQVGVKNILLGNKVLIEAVV